MAYTKSVTECHDHTYAAIPARYSAKEGSHYGYTFIGIMFALRQCADSNMEIIHYLYNIDKLIPLSWLKLVSVRLHPRITLLLPIGLATVGPRNHSYTVHTEEPWVHMEFYTRLFVATTVLESSVREGLSHRDTGASAVWRQKRDRCSMLAKCPWALSSSKVVPPDVLIDILQLSSFDVPYCSRLMYSTGPDELFLERCVVLLAVSPFDLGFTLAEPKIWSRFHVFFCQSCGTIHQFDIK